MILYSLAATMDGCVGDGGMCMLMVSFASALNRLFSDARALVQSQN